MYTSQVLYHTLKEAPGVNERLHTAMRITAGGIEERFVRDGRPLVDVDQHEKNILYKTGRRNLVVDMALKGQRSVADTVEMLRRSKQSAFPEVREALGELVEGSEHLYQTDQLRTRASAYGTQLASAGVAGVLGAAVFSYIAGSGEVGQEYANLMQIAPLAISATVGGMFGHVAGSEVIKGQQDELNEQATYIDTRINAVR